MMAEQATRYSIKRRLLVVLLLATLLAWVATLVLSYRDTRHELEELLDAHLAQSASLLIAQIGHEPEEIDNEHAPQLHRYGRDVAFQIWEHGRKLLLHSASAPNVPLSSRREGFSDSDLGGKHWRVFSTWDETRHFLIQVGERREVRDELAETIAENLMLPILITLPLLGVFIWFGVARSLGPLNTLGNQVAERRPENLAPLDIDAVPTEVSPLVDGLNHLFERVRESLNKERRFTADAAHELRTPLAAIRTQAQVARAATSDEERQHALDSVIEGCDRAAHLVEQLLTLARLEPEHVYSRDRCDLRALSMDVIAELAPVAAAKQIDLQLVCDEAIQTNCISALVSILMRNLIDNAVRYSPHGSVVRVTLARTADGAEFSVSDQGPGIPVEAQTRVWERFYRVLGTNETGSGLGLSIVKRIAELHGAGLALAPGDDGRGLRVSVIFPAVR
jgi:two-component system sensor histidine kinase QseC